MQIYRTGQFYIYIYAFRRCFLSKATYSTFRLYIFWSVCVFPGNWTHNLCTSKAMLYHWATGTQILAMWPEKFSLSSITTPRFLSVFEGVMVDESNWKMKLWWNDGFAETTSSSVLARFSWRWWSFIQLEMSARHIEMRAAIVRSSGLNER